MGPAAWIAVAFVMVAVCAMIVLGIYAAGSGTPSGQSIVGRWEPLSPSPIPGLGSFTWEFLPDGTGKSAVGPITWKMQSGSICAVDMIGQRFLYRVQFDDGKLLLTPTIQGRDASPLILKRSK